MKNSIQTSLLNLYWFIICLGMLIPASRLQAQSNHGNKFEQMGTMLASPNQYRGVDGAPGPDYWQQRCDYDIECTLDTENQRLEGSEWITYYNQSLTPLNFLWLQLDENQHAAGSDNQRFNPTKINTAMSERELRSLEPWRENEKFGHNIQSVKSDLGVDLNYTINKTMMRLDLNQPLKPGDKIRFNIKWNYYLKDRMNTVGSNARGGYEYFEEDDNYLFTIVQWYPRLCAYSDFEGWQTNQFTGRGEFALTFGNFVVKMTLPSDYVVGSTGECLNYSTVLTDTQMKRWEMAQNSKQPIEIVNLEEAKKMEKKKGSKATQTWIYKADQVRDFAWTASRKFIWDAMPYVTEEGRTVMCMSYYPKESYPIYNRYSTKAVVHTLKTYSKYTIPYPYPVAISVEAANGMEYPMICFNPGRAEKDGTYTEQAKNRAITVIIHEVGHNYFPMIINSDERQWAWFDEGLNTFMHFRAEQEFDNNYKSTMAGPPQNITAYMSLPKDQLEPIMTNSENIVDYFSNAYAKPAVALTILRETILGRELFDFAFKEYSRRWAFKHPTPTDFFRTMEEASGVDLDWFWKGWFFSIDNVDISLDSIDWYKVDLENNPEKREQMVPTPALPPLNFKTRALNKKEGIQFAVEEDTALQDFYSSYRGWETEDSSANMKIYLYDKTYEPKEKAQLFGENNYYQLHFSNKGGLVMPVILEWTFEDGTKEIETIPVEIWRQNENSFTKVFVKNKVVTGIQLDPYRETADVDERNNNWPVKELPTRFQVFKEHKIGEQINAMQRAQRKKKIVKP